MSVLSICSASLSAEQYDENVFGFLPGSDAELWSSLQALPRLADWHVIWRR